MESSFSQKEVGRGAVIGFARITMAAALVVGLGCTDSTGPVRLKIEPAATIVRLQSSAQGLTLSTSVTLTNTTSQAVSYSDCGVSLEKVGPPELPPGKGTWETVWARICYLLDNNPAALSTAPGVPTFFGPQLQPGESVTIPVEAVVGQSPYPNFTGEPGSYRFHIVLATQFMGRYVTIPHDQSVSTNFSLLPAS